MPTTGPSTNEALGHQLPTTSPANTRPPAPKTLPNYPQPSAQTLATPAGRQPWRRSCDLPSKSSVPWPPHCKEAAVGEASREADNSERGPSTMRGLLHALALPSMVTANSGDFLSVLPAMPPPNMGNPHVKTP